MAKPGPTRPAEFDPEATIAPTVVQGPFSKLEETAGTKKQVDTATDLKGERPAGLSIELYCFANTTNSNNYETIRVDLSDHLIAELPEFGRRIDSKAHVFRSVTRAQLAAQYTPGTGGRAFPRTQSAAA